MPPEAGGVSEDLVVRPVVEDDLAAVAEVYLAARRAAAPAMPPSVHPDDDVRAWVARLPQEHEVWTAEARSGPAGGRAVGFAALTSDWLDSLYVDPRHQRAGIGSVLLDLAKSRRPEGFSLWVFAANHPARAFYRRHGLLELEHTDGSANEEGAPDVRMAWPGVDPLTFLRRQIDDVDDELAPLLARRMVLTAAVQEHKDRPGLAGRDPEREQRIAARMTARAPGLSPAAAAGITRIMDAVITESLRAWEDSRGSAADPPG